MHSLSKPGNSQNRPIITNSLNSKYSLPIPSHRQESKWIDQRSQSSSFTGERDLSTNMPYSDSFFEDTHQTPYRPHRYDRSFLQPPDLTLPENSIQIRTKSSPTLINTQGLQSPYARSPDANFNYHHQNTRNAYSLANLEKQDGNQTERQRLATPLFSGNLRDRDRSALTKSMISPQPFSHPILENLVSGIPTPKSNFNYNNNWARQDQNSICYRKGIFVQIDFLQRLLEFLTLQDVLNFKSLCHPFRNSKPHKKAFKKRIQTLLSKSLSKTEQYMFWNDHVNFRAIRQMHPLAFTQQFVRKCECIRDITKDLERTFPEYNQFSTVKGRDGLLKVLVGVANTVREVGYIQGLNLIAGVFLLSLKEEESFWMMIYLLEKLEFKQVLKSNFERVSVLNYQLEIYIKNYFPSIAHRFDDEGISFSYISNQWFITLFSYLLNVPMILKLWNMFFVRGYPFLIQFGLAIFAKFQDEIMESNPDEIGIFLKSKLYELDANEDSLFKTALDFKVTKRLLKDLEKHYYAAGKPTTNLKLACGYDGKSVWKTNNNIKSPMKENINYEQKQQFLRTPVKNLRSKSSEVSKTPPKTKQQDVPIMKMILNKITTKIPQNLKNIFSHDQSDTPQKNPIEINLPSSLQRQVSLEKGGFLDKRRHSSGLVFAPADQAHGESPEMKKKNTSYIGSNTNNYNIKEMKAGPQNLLTVDYIYKNITPPSTQFGTHYLTHKPVHGHHRRSSSNTESSNFTYASAFNNVQRYSGSLKEFFAEENNLPKQNHIEFRKVQQSLDNLSYHYQQPVKHSNPDNGTPYFPLSPNLE